MDKITKSPDRIIIKDFALEISKAKQVGQKPEKTVINFRHDVRNNKERDIYEVPIELLRYRKDNGRIASDVLSYEKNHGLLDETTKKTQEILRKFLEEKDKEKTEELELSIEHDRQREPAIITCDGFLINGNRRKMVFEKLLNKSRQYSTMRVVILPGEEDKGEGGPPTRREIEEIENRYQLQSDGKAEYYSFDKALSMKRKIELCMSLEDQLHDDPKYAHLTGKKLQEAVDKMKAEYLIPLECVDEYLKQFGREGLYDTISSGISDREGRWQAFLDYSKLHERLKNPKKRVQDGIEENEVGKIESAAYKIIRKREIDQLGMKVHQVMRDLPKWIQNKDAKKEILKLAEEEMKLIPEEKFDSEGKEIGERAIDEKWGRKFREPIIRHVKRAYQLYTHKHERETPINLLEASLAKLNHPDMNVQSIDLVDYSQAMKLTQEIQHKAKLIEKDIYKIEKNCEELKKKYPKK